MKRSKVKSIMASWYFPWLVAGLVVKLVVSVISLHPDIWGLSLTPMFLTDFGVINIYQHLGSLTPETSAYARSLGTADVFIYPPLVYFTLGLFHFLLLPFFDQQFISLVANTLGGTLGDPRLFTYLFLVKLPYVLFDFAALYFIYQLAKDQVMDDGKQAKLVFFLWLFNPIVFYATYMIGNFDIIPVFLTVLGSYYFIKRNNIAGFLSFGLGAAYKTYPILLGLPLIFYFGKTLKQKIVFASLLAGPYLLSSLPFITTSEYRQDVLFNPKNSKFLFMGLPVSGAEVLYIFIVGLVLLTAFAAYYAHKRYKLFYLWPLSILLLFYSVTHYHPQWMIWIVPFAILLFAYKPWSRWPIALLLACFLATIFFFEPSLNIGIFGPIFPESTRLLGLSDLLSSRFDVFELKSLVRSVFAGIAIFIIIRSFISFSRAVNDTVTD